MKSISVGQGEVTYTLDPEGVGLVIDEVSGAFGELALNERTDLLQAAIAKAQVEGMGLAVSASWIDSVPELKAAIDSIGAVASDGTYAIYDLDGLAKALGGAPGVASGVAVPPAPSVLDYYGVNIHMGAVAPKVADLKYNFRNLTYDVPSGGQVIVKLRVNKTTLSLEGVSLKGGATAEEARTMLAHAITADMPTGVPLSVKVSGLPDPQMQTMIADLGENPGSGRQDRADDRAVRRAARRRSWADCSASPAPCQARRLRRHRCRRPRR